MSKQYSITDIDAFFEYISIKERAFWETAQELRRKLEDLRKHTANLKSQQSVTDGTALRRIVATEAREVIQLCQTLRASGISEEDLRLALLVIEKVESVGFD